MRPVKSIFHTHWLGCFSEFLSNPCHSCPPPHFMNRVQTSNLARASLKEPGKEPLILAACACCKAAIWWTILQIPEIWVFPQFESAPERAEGCSFFGGGCSCEKLIWTQWQWSGAWNALPEKFLGGSHRAEVVPDTYQLHSISKGNRFPGTFLGQISKVCYI